jgi:hypothetical protein
MDNRGAIGLILLVAAIVIVVAGLAWVLDSLGLV